ncbi:hypothetical protein D3C75_1148320 [compost metagenome]
MTARHIRIAAAAVELPTSGVSRLAEVSSAAPAPPGSRLNWPALSESICTKKLGIHARSTPNPLNTRYNTL